MKPAAFKYVEATDESSITAALTRYGAEARVLAGGQSLVPLMNFRVATPAVLVDLNGVSSLSYIRLDQDILTIGAMARHAMIEDSPEIAERCPLLHEAIGYVAHRAVRNRGTLGGSLALAYPGAEVPLVLAALDAEIHLCSSRGARVMTAGKFIRGALVTALDEDEYVRSAQIRLPPASAKSSFVEVTRRHGDFAIAAAAVVVDFDAQWRVTYARAAVSGGTETPVRLPGFEQTLLGLSDDTAPLHDKIRDAIGQLDVAGDYQYPEDYRRHLLGTALHRAVSEAFRKAGYPHVR